MGQAKIELGFNFKNIVSKAENWWNSNNILRYVENARIERHIRKQQIQTI